MADFGLNLRKRQKAPFTPAHPYAAIKGGPYPLFLYISNKSTILSFPARRSPLLNEMEARNESVLSL
jgi:hypothetical protein